MCLGITVKSFPSEQWQLFCLFQKTGKVTEEVFEGHWWDGWMASPTQWTWVWVGSRSWWWTGRPGVLQSMGLQKVAKSRTRLSDWAELNWIKYNPKVFDGCQKLAWSVCLKGSRYTAGKSEELRWARMYRWSKGNVKMRAIFPGFGRSSEGGHGNPLQYSCLENPHGQRSLAGCSPWGYKESDVAEQLRTA